MAKKPRFYEVNNPKQDVEYWVVVDEQTELPHYFKTKEQAQAYADYYGHEIVFHECFN